MSNEDKLDLFADVLEPVAEIISDEAFAAAMKKRPIDAVKVALKAHKGAVLAIMARIDNKPVSEYRMNGLVLFARLARFVKRPEVADLFISQGEDGSAAESSTPATVTIQDGAK